jgi:hypothetical protein
MGGMLGRGIGGIFHEGGTIEGNRDEKMILAQTGEGVLSRRGMKAIGGSRTLDAINSGDAEMAAKAIRSHAVNNEGVYHEGGTIGSSSSSSGTSFNPKAVTRGDGGSRQMVDNSQYTVKAEVKGGSTGNRRDDKRLARDLAKQIDKEMSKLKKDRNSRFADSMKDD